MASLVAAATIILLFQVIHSNERVHGNVLPSRCGLGSADS
jgi:hypothetical protein